LDKNINYQLKDYNYYEYYKINEYNPAIERYKFFPSFNNFNENVNIYDYDYTNFTLIYKEEALIKNGKKKCKCKCTNFCIIM